MGLHGKMESAEWIPSEKDIDSVLLCMYSSDSSTNKTIPKPLEGRALEIGPDTLSAGLDIILLEACRKGLVDIVSFILQHSQTLPLNRVYRYTFAQKKLGEQRRYTSDPHFVTPSRRTVTFINPIRQEEEVSVISWSNTLLHIAADSNHVLVVELLIKAGANIDVLNCCGRTPLMLGLKSPSVTKTLLAAGANVNLKDKQGLTALLLAIEGGAPIAVVTMLLKKGSDHRICDNSGLSFLHKVYSLKRIDNPVDYTKLLVKRGILLTCADNGLLLCSGLPLGIATLDDKLLMDQDENQFFSKDVRLSLKYLKPALCLVNIACLPERKEEYRSALIEALKFKDYCKLSIRYPPTHEAYLSTEEVTDPSIVAGLSDEQLMIQNLIVTERVAGYGSHMLIWLIIHTYWCIDNSLMKCSLLRHAITMVLHRLKQYGSEKKIPLLVIKLMDSISTLCYLQVTEFDLIMVSDLLSCTTICLENLKCLHGHYSGSLITKESKYRFSEFRGETFDMTRNALHLLKNLYFNRVDIKHLLTKLMGELQFVISPKDKIHTLLSVAYYNTVELVDLMLDCGGDRWTHIRVLNGDLLIHLILSHENESGKKYMTGEDPKLAKKVLELGMHSDCVDSNNKPLYSLLPPSLLHYLMPNETGNYLLRPLTCISAGVIVAEGIQYWKEPLPKRVIEFIGLHDHKSFQRQLKHTLDLP